jgi:hypothetical protein
LAMISMIFVELDSLKGTKISLKNILKLQVCVQKNS